MLEKHGWSRSLVQNLFTKPQKQPLLVVKGISVFKTVFGNGNKLRLSNTRILGDRHMLFPLVRSFLMRANQKHKQFLAVVSDR